MENIESDDISRRLGDSFAVALLQWPPLVAALALNGAGWALPVKIICAVWVTLVALSLIFGRRAQGPRWGVAMGLCAGLVAAAYVLHGSIWLWLPLSGLLFSFHAALKIRLTEKTRNADVPLEAEPAVTTH